MTHENRKKVLAKLLAAVMILSLLPIQVLAATNASYNVLDSQVQIATSAQNGGSSQDSATGAITATAAASGSCSYTATTTTITITNKSGSEQMLYMNYSLTLSGGSCSIDGSSTTDISGRILKTLASGGSFAITITSNSENTNKTSITLSDFAFVSDEEYAITFNAPGEGATMSIGGEAITDWDENGQYTVRAACQPGIEISAAIASGYTFYYWLQCEEGAEQSGRVLSSDTSFTLQPTSDMIIELVVIKASDADGLFLVGSEVFSDFTAALRAAESGTDKVVIPLRDCIIPEGEYYIPEGVTLLIPFNDENTVYTDTPGYNLTPTTPSAYRRVTLASNAEISVDGAISIGAMHTPAANGKRMSVNGKYGQLILQEGSCITLNDGANLYAWGYVTGSGEVKAMSGATVYEYFQLADFRGGTVTKNMIGNDYDVFPMSSYYVQNIEARLVLYYGAKEMGYASVYALSTTVGASPTFIGEGGLFQLSAPDGVSENTDDSYIVKYYDPISDKLYVEVYGNASIKSISMTVAIFSVNSADYILPINNMIIKLIRGGLTTDQRIMLMPGSGLVIGEEAALSLADTASETSALYVVAREEWGPFTWNGVDNNYIAPVVYSPSWTNGCPRTWANTESAFLEVNGTVNVNGILATSASAVVTSTGRGAINYNCTASAGALYGYAQSSGKYVAIPTNSAVLQNADGTTVETADAVANDYYEYSDGFWLKNGEEPPVTNYHIIFRNYDGTTLYEVDVAEGEIPVYEGATPEKPADAQYTYTFSHWSPDVVAVTGDATYTAVFTASVNTYTITWVVEGVEATETYAYGATPVYPGGTPTKPADAQYTYTFSHWSPDVVAVTGDATYTAVFTASVNTYTITWVVEGVETTETYAYGATPVYPNGTPTKPADAQYTYTFSHWSPDVVAVTGDATYTAVFSSSVNTYTITWVVEGVETTETYAYGATPVYPNGTPTKPADAQYTYTFSHWTPDVVAVTGDATYTAVFSSSVNTYTITWVVEGVETTETYAYGATPVYPNGTPTKPADAQYTYTFSHWSPDVVAVTGDATYTAVFSSSVNTYTITWVVEGVETTETYAYGATPVYPNGTPTKPADAQYTYTFSHWSPDVVAVTGDATYTAVFSSSVNTYTITWVVEGVETTETYAYGETPVYPNGTPTKPADAQYTYTFSHWSPDVVAVTGDATYTAVFSSSVNTYTITYNVNGVFYAEQTYEYGAAVTAPEYTCEYTYYHFSGWAVPETMPAHDASYDAVMSPYDGIEWYADELYLFDNGEMVEFPGLVRVVTDNDVKYYYFGENNYAARARMVDGEFVTEYMVERNNGLLFAGDNYIFGEDGVIEHRDYTLNGISEVDGDLYYHIDGVIIRHGLVKVGGSFYYCRSTSGKLVRDTRYWVTRTNGLTWADGTPIEAGYYFFDEEAKLSDKNGIIAENGSLYYYVHGSLTPAGLIELDGDYYYVRTSNCEVIHGRSYWITVTNGLMPIGLYEFDDTGKMLNPPTGQPGEEEPEIKNGIVAEFGSLYYYVDGVLTPAGLIELDGEYYYVRTSNCEVVHGCSYWITVTNGLMPAGMYTFADDGKLIH